MANDTITLPDVERLVCDWLRGQLADVPVGTTLVGWRAGTAHVQVRRTGGGVRMRWVDTADMTIDVRHASREAAAALATRARQAMALMARQFIPPDAVLSRVEETRGPGWMPEPDGQGRYRMEWQVVCHPAPPTGGL